MVWMIDPLNLPAGDIRGPIRSVSQIWSGKSSQRAKCQRKEASSTSQCSRGAAMESCVPIWVDRGWSE